MTDALELIEIPTDGPVRAVFTTRRGGVSAEPFRGLNLGSDRGDAETAVRANRALLCDRLGIDAARVSLVRQVHGAGVHRVVDPCADDRFAEGLTGRPEADAMVTLAPERPVMVLGADCLPVILWRRDRAGVAAAHAGWRGLVGGVLEATLDALGEPACVGVAIGPGIGPCCYPVSPEVRDSFAKRFGDAVVVGDAVELAAAARSALVGAGVPATAIHVQGSCTSCEPERFYSHRRDGAASGRHAGLGWIVAQT